MSKPDPASIAPASYQRDIYAQFRPPLFSTKPSEWERLASLKVPADRYGYTYGSANTGRTYSANREAFDRYRLRPHMLVNATQRDLSVTLFGTTYASPLLAAPIGVQSTLHHEAEEATARACRRVGIPMILSSAASRTIEQVAAQNGPDGKRWFQLYWPKPEAEDITASILTRARENGYDVLVVTLDTFTLGWRPTDLDTAYLPFLWGEGCQIGHSDPVFLQRFSEQQAGDQRTAMEKLSEAYELLKRPGSLYGALRILANAGTLRKSQAWLDVMFSGTYHEWKDLARLKKYWSGPIVLKGIQTVHDARKAIEHGVDGIIVSNHGGRQVDGAIASLDALAEITADEEVSKSGLTVLFDSGVRTGSDVVKAIALGAKAVLVGRPYVYGLAIEGAEGVEHVLKCMMADVDNTMANMGKTKLEELSRSDLQVIPLQASAKL